MTRISARITADEDLFYPRFIRVFLIRVIRVPFFWKR
jgi:hypothetical protein